MNPDVVKSKQVFDDPKTIPPVSKAKPASLQKSSVEKSVKQKKKKYIPNSNQVLMKIADKLQVEVKGNKKKECKYSRDK